MEIAFFDMINIFLMASNLFLDLAVAKSLQSTRTVTDDADNDVLTTTGYTCCNHIEGF